MTREEALIHLGVFRFGRVIRGGERPVRCWSSSMRSRMYEYGLVWGG